MNKKINNKGEKKYLVHSLSGNTRGSNNTQTVVNILKQTTENSTIKSLKINKNQPKKEGE